MKSDYRSVPSSRNGLAIACRVDAPEETTGASPAIIMAAGLGGTMTESGHLRPFVDAFVPRGYACVTFDYISWGKSEGRHRHILDVSHQLADYRDVIDWVKSQPARFDPARLVAWGSSFGGMHVAAVLSSDASIAAGILQCPLVDGLGASLQLPLRQMLGLGPAGMRDALRELRGKEPYYVAVVSNGKDYGLMPTQEAVEGCERVLPGFPEGPHNKVAARIALKLGMARPGTAVRKSTKPMLFVLPEWDNQADLRAARRCAKLAPKGEVLDVKGGHFDLYQGGPGFEENIGGQLEFLTRVAPTATGR